MIIAGVILSFKSDHLRKQPLKKIVKHLIKNPHLIVIDIAAASAILLVIDYIFLDLSSLIQGHYFASGLALLMLEVSYCFVLVPYALNKLFTRSMHHYLETTSTNEYLCRSGIPTFFTLHVMIDMKLDWSDACALSMNGYWVMRKNRHAVYLMLGLVFVFPAATILVLPWLYAVYKELFWQCGLKEPSSCTTRGDSLAIV